MYAGEDMKKLRWKTMLARLPLKSLQKRLILIIFFFLIIPLSLISRYNFNTMKAILEEKTSRLSMDSMDKISMEFKNATQVMAGISNTCGVDKEILESLEAVSYTPQADKYDLDDYYQMTSDDIIRTVAVQNRLTKIKSSFITRCDIVLIDRKGALYTSLDYVQDDFDFKTKFLQSYLDTSWYQTLSRAERTGMWVAPFSYGLQAPYENTYIVLARTLKSSHNREPLGILLVCFPQERFHNFFLDNGGELSLLNENDKIVFSTDRGKTQAFLRDENIVKTVSGLEQGSFSVTADRKQYMLNCIPLETLNYNLISVVPLSNMMEEMTSLNRQVTTINLIFIGSFTILCILSILHLTNPLKKLIGEFKKLKIGEYSIDNGQLGNTDDVRGIVSSFGYLLRRIEELVGTVFTEQEKKHKLEYEALRTQIRPHFLFNTLNSIKWVANMSGTANIARMISALGMLLEVSIREDEDEITLQNEAELIESYVYIQNVRYYNRFTLKIDIPEPLKAVKVQKFILQPVVENSITHGFNDMKEESGEACIRICAFVAEDRLILRLDDNGSGIKQELTDRLLLDGVKPGNKKTGGIGLKNVNERIKLKYGTEYGLRILPGEGRGTRVVIVLPHPTKGGEIC